MLYTIHCTLRFSINIDFNWIESGIIDEALTQYARNRHIRRLSAGSVVIRPNIKVKLLAGCSSLHVP